MGDDEPGLWVVPSNRGNALSEYHTDPDCRMLDLAADVKCRQPEQLPDDLMECSVCAGDIDPDGGDHSLNRLLQDDSTTWDDVVNNGGNA